MMSLYEQFNVCDLYGIISEENLNTFLIVDNINKKADECRNKKGRICLSISKMEIIYYLWIFKVYPPVVLPYHPLSGVKKDIYLQIIYEINKTRTKTVLSNFIYNDEMMNFFHIWIKSRTNKIKLCYYLKEEMMKQKRILVAKLN